MSRDSRCRSRSSARWPTPRPSSWPAARSARPPISMRSAVMAYEMLAGRRPVRRRRADGACPAGAGRRDGAAVVAAAGGGPRGGCGDRCGRMAAIAGRSLAERDGVRRGAGGEFSGARRRPTTRRTIDGAGLLGALRRRRRARAGPVRQHRAARHCTARSAMPVAIRHLKRSGQPQWDGAARPVPARGADAAGAPSASAARARLRRGRERRVRRDRLVDRPEPAGVLASGPLSWALARRLILQMTDAAEALHAARRIAHRRQSRHDSGHRRARRERLVLTTGGIRALTDVLATMREQQLRGQEPSELELPYMAPEVLTGRAPDARTDLFTVGVVAYQLVTGRVPYRAATLPGADWPDAAPVGPRRPAGRRARPAAGGDLRCLARRSGRSRHAAGPADHRARSRRRRPECRRWIARQPATRERADRASGGRAARRRCGARCGRRAPAPAIDVSEASWPAARAPASASPCRAPGGRASSSRATPAAVMRVVTTRRSACSRDRASSPRASSRSSRRVTSGSRVTSRDAISEQVWPSAPAPRRMRSTLYCASDSWCGLSTAATSRVSSIGRADEVEVGLFRADSKTAGAVSDPPAGHAHGRRIVVANG